MGYWMTVYSRSDRVKPVEEIEAFFRGDDVKLDLCGSQRGATWKQVALDHPDGNPIFLLNVHTSAEDDFGERLDEDIEMARESEPQVNGEWVAGFLAGVKVIYAFQIGSGVHAEGWDYVRDLQDDLCTEYDGILHAEAEGYSNELGLHVTWEFSDDVAPGNWNMALYDPRSATWTNFVMDLGNPAHREAFRAGRVPEGVEIIPPGTIFSR
jgi:hypothetical protein